MKRSTTEAPDKVTVRPCRFVAEDQPRAILREHLDGCDDAQCRGCLPCQAAHCVVCGRAHLADEDNRPPLTCTGCVHRVRADIRRIVELCSDLPDQAANAGRDGRLAAAAPIPGGNAMVLMGPSADFGNVLDLAVYARNQADHREETGERTWEIPALVDHLPDDVPGDPEPPLQALTWIADRWRQARDEPTHLRATVTRSADYLVERLDWAAQTIDQFDEVARLDSDCLHGMEDSLAEGERNLRTDVSCIECGGQLIQKAAKPAPCRHHRAAAAVARKAAPNASPGFLELLTQRIQRTMLDNRPDLAREHATGCDQGGFYQPGDDPDKVVRLCRKCGHRYTVSQYTIARRSKLEDVANEDAR